MNYRLIAFLIFLFLFHQNFASDLDSTRGKYSWSIRRDHGFLIAHRPALVPLQEKHISGFEISLAKISSGKNEWERDFLNPSRGITLAYFDLGSPDKLGYGIAVYPYIDFPLNNKTDNKLIFRYGIGLGWVEKTFNSTDNFKNAAIGSNLNGIIHFDLHYEKLLSKFSLLEISAAITHYSNGSYSIPNLGINVATLNLAYTRYFGEKLAINRTPSIAKPKTSNWITYIGAGLKKIYPPEGKQYNIGVVSVSRMFSIGNKSNWGFGIDGFYDNSLSARLERVNAELKGFSDDFRTGIFGAIEVSAGKTGLLFNMGYYLFSRWKEDGNIYHRICVRQYFDKFFLCMNLKTHYARADFVEFGIGKKF
ncbi:MAG: acyloxyacyl hydrolase [Bacteroidota bacterium]